MREKEIYDISQEMTTVLNVKHMDCVEVCDTQIVFMKVKTCYVINPDECIDCGVQ